MGRFVLLVSALSCSCSQPYKGFVVGQKGLGCPFLCAALFPWLFLARPLDRALENDFFFSPLNT